MKIFAGVSLATGFRILFNDKKKKVLIIVDSREFLTQDSCSLSPKTNFRKKTFHLFCLLVILPLLFHCLFFWKGNIVADMISLLTLALSVWSSAALIIWVGRFDLATKQWHSCEHKLIGLLKRLVKQNSDQNLTTDKLKKQGRTHWGCGTTMQVFFPFALFGLYLICILMPAQFLLMPYGFYFYFGLINVVLGILVFFLILFVLSSLVQLFFLTVEPTQEQLEETIRVGEEFLMKYQQLTSG